MLRTSDIRIAFALIASLAVHGMLLGYDNGMPRNYSVSRTHNKVTFRLVARQQEPLPEQPEKIEKIEKKKEPEVIRKIVQQQNKTVPEKPRKVALTEKPKKQPVPEPVQNTVREPPREELQVVDHIASEPQDYRENMQSNVTEQSVNVQETDFPEVVMAVPLYKVNPPPHYPAKARRRNLQGTVILEVTVSALGKVEHLEVKAGCGHRTLDKAAVSAVQEWLFEPGRRNGVPVRMTVMVPVRFALK